MLELGNQRTGMSGYDDLSTLVVVPSDRKKLESMGFTTLEQLAMLNEYDLGMGKEKGRAIIQRARNILCNRHIKDIRILKDEVIVTLDQNANDPLIASVKDILKAYTDQFYRNCSLETEANKIKLLNAQNPNYSFDQVVESAKRWQAITQSKQRNELAKQGITLKEDEIVKFAKERGFDGFCDNVFIELKGNETLKRSLGVALFSTFEEPNHVLVIGDPASGKTFAKDIIVENFKDVSNVGAMSTRAGLVMSMASGQLGVLAYSDKKVVLVDEFDKIPEDDVQYIYELLSNGKCSVHSAKVHTDIESHFIMIALGNPKFGAFVGDPMQEINLPPPLISRFSLVIKTPILGDQDRKEVFKKKLQGGSELRKLPEYYNQWVKLACLHNPQLKCSTNKLDTYIDEANQLITRLYRSPLRRDLRMADYARRVPFAMARAEFSDVTDETLDKALSLIKRSIDDWYSKS